jgi:hypothetical protein
MLYVPHRDWPPRDEEFRRVRYLTDPRYAGIWQLAAHDQR